MFFVQDYIKTTPQKLNGLNSAAELGRIQNISFP